MLVRLFLFMTALMSSNRGSTQTLVLSQNKVTPYKICLPVNATAVEIKAAGILQTYFTRVTGAPIVVEREGAKTRISRTISIGSTHLCNPDELKGLTEGGFIIKTDRDNILINGKGEKGTLYGVYSFLEKYLGCRKWDGGPAQVYPRPGLTIPSAISDKEEPAFTYREVYLPPAFDDEYLDWHKLQRFESLWGLWGHSFYKLVPPSQYFKSHPEYFSLVDGERKPLQLCLSNESVLKITVEKLRKEMADNPSALYWSVSPNDDIGNCECEHCRRLDDAEGGPQGSILFFVNAVAKKFPTKKITTLAYGYSARATAVTRPEANVVIMLSSIDAYRSKPLANEPSAAAFRNNLLQWKEKTKNIFVWDYCTQFTNYLAPFPVTPFFKPNIDLFIKHGVSGVFEQGSADTYSDMPELKSYVFSRLLWNPAGNADELTQDFLNGYYGKAAPVIAEYLSLLQRKIESNGTRLDIYGNPVNNHADYLSPVNMDQYSQLMDKAEELTSADNAALQHVRLLRLTHEYVYLQQAKFYGKDKHGLFEKDEQGNFYIKPFLPKRVERFSALAKTAGVKELSEGGISPEKYSAQWQHIFSTPARTNLAANAQVRLSYPFAPEYRSKNERTLVDETPGYDDFSYNWLCFYAVPLEAVVDMGTAKKVSSVSLNFLEDARHWIFRPASVSVEVSADGRQYRQLPVLINKMMDEDFTVNFLPFRFEIRDDIRFIRVKADNWPRLPAWRHHKYKKPMIACDEIWVE